MLEFKFDTQLLIEGENVVVENMERQEQGLKG